MAWSAFGAAKGAAIHGWQDLIGRKIAGDDGDGDGDGDKKRGK